MLHEESGKEAPTRDWNVCAIRTRKYITRITGDEDTINFIEEKCTSREVHTIPQNLVIPWFMLSMGTLPYAMASVPQEEP